MGFGLSPHSPARSDRCAFGRGAQAVQGGRQPVAQRCEAPLTAGAERPCSIVRPGRVMGGSPAVTGSPAQDPATPPACPAAGATPQALAGGAHAPGARRG